MSLSSATLLKDRIQAFYAKMNLALRDLEAYKKAHGFCTAGISCMRRAMHGNACLMHDRAKREGRKLRGVGTLHLRVRQDPQGRSAGRQGDQEVEEGSQAEPEEGGVAMAKVQGEARIQASAVALVVDIPKTFEKGVVLLKIGGLTFPLTREELVTLLFGDADAEAPKGAPRTRGKTGRGKVGRPRKARSESEDLDEEIDRIVSGKRV